MLSKTFSSQNWFALSFKSCIKHCVKADHNLIIAVLLLWISISIAPLWNKTAQSLQNKTVSLSSNHTFVSSWKSLYAQKIKLTIQWQSGYVTTLINTLNKSPLGSVGTLNMKQASRINGKSMIEKSEQKKRGLRLGSLESRMIGSDRSCWCSHACTEKHRASCISKETRCGQHYKSAQVDV